MTGGDEEEKSAGKNSYVAFVICFSFQMVWEQCVVVIVNLTKLSDLGLVSTVYNIRKEILKCL